jgi:hypothetical protein
MGPLSDNTNKVKIKIYRSKVRHNLHRESNVVFSVSISLLLQSVALVSKGKSESCRIAVSNYSCNEGKLI